ncbi:MAG TPA: hypothetical protein VFZ78_07270 [Flavisolibacter sp.]
MTFISKKPGAGTIIIAAVSLFVLFYVSSCATKVSFLNSTVVPAAEGTVKVKKDSNKNYDIKIELKNLAEPDRLQPSKSMYIVWMESSDNATRNLGRISSSSAFMSSKLKGSFEAVSSVKPTKIFITAEDQADIQYPGSLVVLTTNNF